MEKYNSLLNINFGRYIEGDHGVRVNAVRYFKDIAVGFWASYSGGEPNGGFNFAIPLGPKNIKNKRIFRISLPDHFFWEYSGRVWPKEGVAYSVHNDYFYHKFFYLCLLSLQKVLAREYIEL